MDRSLKRQRRNRSWPEALKQEIVAASLALGSSVSLVARRYDVNANQVFAWRKQYRDGTAELGAPRLVPVTVRPEEPAEAVPARTDDLIEVELVSGYRVRVGR